MVLPQQPPPPWKYPYPQNLTNFQPQAKIVQIIIPGFPTQVTTTTPHQYQSNLLVKLFNSEGYPYPAILNATYPITITSPTQFTIPLDSRTLPPVTVAAMQKAQILPVAETGQSLTSATNNAVNN